jgi:hypothetical protein
MVMRKILDLFRRQAKLEHIMEDDLFGTLTWREDQGGWCGIMALANGRSVKFTIDLYEPEVPIDEATRDTAKFLIANETQIRHKIAVSMSEFYNGTWGSGDTITPDELAQRITLTGVSFSDEGMGALYYEADDELFSDHTICASIDANGEIDEPVLEG